MGFFEISRKKMKGKGTGISIELMREEEGNQ